MPAAERSRPLSRTHTYLPSCEREVTLAGATCNPPPRVIPHDPRLCFVFINNAKMGSEVRMIYEFDSLRPWLAESVFVAPSADVIGNVVVGEHSSIWFGAVLRADSGAENALRIGERTSVQDNCVIHVSTHRGTVIGNDVTIGHGAILEACTIHDRALIGMNAVVLEDVEVGEGALVAAGSVLTAGTRVPPGVLVAGTPARIKKEIAGDSAWWIARSAEHYVELAERYMREL